MPADLIDTAVAKRAISIGEPSGSNFILWNGKCLQLEKNVRWIRIPFE
jgi:hypothetical protein